MRITAILFFIFSFIQTTTLSAQKTIPTYPQVVEKFYTTYSYLPEESYDKLMFAKKKDGWYVHAVDQLNNDSIKTAQLFWSIASRSYKPLIGFGDGNSKEEVSSGLEAVLQDNGSPNTYLFERCRYFGYNDWDADMINDFGKIIPRNDTLLEGLGRAYSSYAERYLWFGNAGNPFHDPMLERKPSPLDSVSKERVKRFLFYTNKAVDCFALLAKRNPGYQTLVGNARMKMLNEQFHQYQQLLMSGSSEQIKTSLGKISNNDSIYRSIGHSYLDNCPPNSILITYGDNDTYPLWYVQEKDGYRKDVTVINYQLLTVPAYLDMLHRENKVLFTTNPHSFGESEFQYFVADAKADSSVISTQSLPLDTFLNDIQTSKYVNNDAVPRPLVIYQAKKIVLNADIQKLKKICDQSNLTSSLNIDLHEYLLLSDFVILDMLNQNLYIRPVCSTVQLELFPKQDYQREATIFRLLPLNEHLDDIKVRTEIEKTEKYLTGYTTSLVIFYGSTNKYYETATQGMHTQLFSDLINNILQLGDTISAKRWTNLYLANSVTKKISPNQSNGAMCDILLRLGYLKEGKEMSEKLADWYYYLYKNYSAVHPYYSKERYLGILQYYKNLLDTYKASSALVDKLVSSMVRENKQ
ncbi:MAG: hypothetical protein ABI480_17845 [Chitinophagaceae bacterium]